jgi:hypothetical protein
MTNFLACLTAVGWLLNAACACAEPMFPPQLPGGQSVVTLLSEELLTPSANLRADVVVARTPPQVDVLYYPGQDYEGKPWSVWGDGLAVGTRYYSSIGDHRAPQGNAFVYVYDAETRALRRIVDVQSVLKLPEGHYLPGKIHSRIDLGRDGWLYFSTHRGSTRVTTDEYHYKGDWILRHHPERGQTEVVAHAPLPKQCLPTSVLDPERLIFYAGTADGDTRAKRVMFLAYDVAQRRVLYSDEQGPYRAAIFAPSTGRVYFQQSGSRGEVLPLVRFDPQQPGPPQQVAAEVGLRACSHETRDRHVYCVDGDQLWVFHTDTETAESLGPTAVGTQTYIASLDLDPLTERYLYYVPGAHGGSQTDGTPIVQYDVKTGVRKVLAFLQPACHAQTGFTPMGTYGLAVSPDGATLYITWNGNQGDDPASRRLRFNTCALTVVQIPASERQP